MKKTGLIASVSIFAVGSVIAVGGICLYQWDAISLGIASMIVSAMVMFAFTEED